jgi:hypothetical protein
VRTSGPFITQPSAMTMSYPNNAHCHTGRRKMALMLAAVKLPPCPVIPRGFSAMIACRVASSRVILPPSPRHQSLPYEAIPFLFLISNLRTALSAPTKVVIARSQSHVRRHSAACQDGL